MAVATLAEALFTWFLGCSHPGLIYTGQFPWFHPIYFSIHISEPSGILQRCPASAFPNARNTVGPLRFTTVKKQDTDLSYV